MLQPWSSRNQAKNSQPPTQPKEKVYTRKYLGCLQYLNGEVRMLPFGYRNVCAWKRIAAPSGGSIAKAPMLQDGREPG